MFCSCWWHVICIVTFNLWLHFNKLLTYLLTYVYQDCTNRVPTMYQKQSKQQKWPLVYQSSQVYQDCTNSVPTVYQSSKSQKQSKTVKTSQNYHWCTNRHMSTKTVPTVYQQCTKNCQKQSKQQKMTTGVPIVTCLHRVRRIQKVRVRVRRIHKAVCASSCCHLANEN